MFENRKKFISQQNENLESIMILFEMSHHPLGIEAHSFLITYGLLATVR